MAVIEKGGAVYGAAFDKDWRVVHCRADTEVGCRAFRSAKYVQSDMGDCFSRIASDLKAGRTVLFSGTPCQVAGLHSALEGTDTSGLVTCDIVCHGVPSPRIWKEYLKLVSKGSPIRLISFRDKRHGWHHSELRIVREDGRVLSEHHGKNAYSLLFFNHYILRPSCARCPFANLSRPGDLTIGDFWGIEKSMPALDDDKGISLVLVNTEEGKKLLSSICPALELYPSDPEPCLQPNLMRPSALAPNRGDFWRTYRRHGLRAAIYIYIYIYIYGWRARLRKALSGFAAPFARKIKRVILGGTWRDPY